MKNDLRNTVLFFAVILTAAFASARWGDIGESSHIVKIAEVNNKVKANGAYEMSYYRVIEIKNDQGRTGQGLYRFNYNPSAEVLDFVEARTINSKQSFKVKKSDIIIKPLSSSGPGFDTQNQVSIAYPNVEVGSKLELKYRLIRTKASVPGWFHDHFSYGRHVASESFRETWDSEVPLFVETFDPKGYFKVIQTSPYKIEVALTKPIFTEVMEEKNAVYSPESLVWVAVTNLKSWSDFPKNTINAYENVINSTLPEKLKSIYDKAKAVEKPIDQINLITSNLADTLRYLGDWRLVKGAYHPRTLEQITKSGYGDCKDMSVSTAAILKKLGYKTHAAFVNRNFDLIASPIKIPAQFFNHAIVWAEKDGQEYWIDPTNFTSSAQRIYPDIADHQTVILDPAGARESKTPAIDAKSNTVKIDLDINIKSDSELEGKGHIELLGFGAESVTGDQLKSSKAQLDFRLVSWSTSIPDLVEWKFDDYDLKSRIVKDFITNFTFKSGWQAVATSAGKSYLVPSLGLVRSVNVPLKDRESSLLLADPFQHIRSVRLTGKSMQFDPKANCDGSFKWFDFKRRLVKEEHDALLLNDFFALKVSSIDIKEIRTIEFKNAQKALVNCMSDFAFVFK